MRSGTPRVGPGRVRQGHRGPCGDRPANIIIVPAFIGRNPSRGLEPVIGLLFGISGWLAVPHLVLCPILTKILYPFVDRFGLTPEPRPEDVAVVAPTDAASR